MKPRHLALLAAFVAVAAAGWFLFLRKDDSSAKKPVGTAPAKDDPWASGGKKDTPRPDGERGGGPEPQVLVDDDPAGTLRLEGLVLSADDTPVEGATVALSANPPRTTTSDENGEFAFDKLVGRPYTLVARAPAGVAGPVTAKLTAKSDPVVLRLALGGSVTVTTVDRAGKPVVAAVELRGVDVQTGSASADGKTRFDAVVPGRYDVVAQAPGFAPTFASALVPAAAPVDVNMVLIPGASVSGRVLSSAGEPVGDALVLYSGASDWNIRPDERRDSVRTTADGVFTFPALPAGSFRFVARHPAHAPGSSSIVTLDGASAKDGIEIRMAQGATVSGVVIDAGGAPVASARVRIGVASRGMLGSEPRQVFSADDGTFSIGGLPRRPLEAVALAERGSSSTVPVDASSGDVAGVKLTIDITGTIAGVVVDKQGEPLEGVQVGAAPDFRSGGFDPQAFRLRGFAQELTDAGGRFELVGLAPGADMVRAARATAGRARQFGLEGERAETGTTDLRIVLPSDGSVKGKVAFADGTVPTPFSVGVGFSSEPVASKDGSFELGALPPRRYQLIVRGPAIDQKTVEVEIKEGEVTDAGTITVSKGRMIAGKVMFQGNPVPGATVFAGRQLFGTGSSNTASVGGGPPGRSNNRETTTDETGRFVISGLGPADIAVVAEHPDIGRSAAIRLQRGVSEEGAVVLTLAPFGSLVGKATDAAGPAAETIITAQSASSANAMYSVATGPDGTYRFDKLAPDVYKVSAMLGMPMRGMTFHSTQVTVVSGKEARADLTVIKGDVTLTLSAKASNGDFRGGFAWLFTGVVAATNGRDLGARAAAQEGGTSSLGIMFGGQPATFKELVPGTYSACVSAIPAEVAGGPQAMTYIERHGDELPAVCKQVTVAPQPKEQQAEVTVVIPPFIPD